MQCQFMGLGLSSVTLCDLEFIHAFLDHSIEDFSYTWGYMCCDGHYNVVL